MKVKSFLVIGFLGALGLGCGGDDSSSADTGEGQAAADTTSAAGTTNSAGVTNTAGGTAGTAATAETMVPPPPEPVPCGSVQCTPPTSPLAGLGAAGIPGLGDLLPAAEACCLDEAAGACGVTAQGAACEALAEPDTRCPSIDAGAFGALLGNVGFGCCTEENLCGVDGAMFGRGCIENSQAGAELAAMGIGGFLTPPAAKGCDEPLPEPEPEDTTEMMTEGTADPALGDGGVTDEVGASDAAVTADPMAEAAADAGI